MSSTAKTQHEDTHSPSAVPILCPLCSHPHFFPAGVPWGDVDCAICQVRFHPRECSLPAASGLGKLQATTPLSQPAFEVDPSAPALQEWLSGAPIKTKERTPVQRLASWSRDNPRLARAVGAGVACLVLYLLGCTGACLFLRHSQSRVLTERGQTQVESRLLENELRLRDRELKVQTQRASQESSQRKQLAERMDALQIQHTASEAARQAAEEKCRQTARASRLAVVTEMTSEARRCADRWPQRSLLLAAEALRVSRHNDATAVCYPALQLVHDLTAKAASRGSDIMGPASSLAASPDGAWLASGAHDGSVRLVQLGGGLESLKPLQLPRHPSAAAALQFSPNGDWLFAHGFDSNVSAWRLQAANGKLHEHFVLQIPKCRIVGLALSADSRWLACAANGFQPKECTIRLWDLYAADPAASQFDLLGHEGRIQYIALSPNGKWVAVVSENGDLKVWSHRAQYPLLPWLVSDGGETSVRLAQFTPDSRWLVTACGASGTETTNSPANPADHAIRLWDLTACDASTAGTTASFSASAQHPLGLIRLPEVHAPSKASRDILLRGHTGTVRAITATADSRWLVSAGDDKSVRIWNLASANTTQPVAILEGHQSPVVAIQISQAPTLLATADSAGRVCLWDLKQPDFAPIGKPLLQLRGGGTAKSLALCGNGRWLASLHGENEVRLWSLHAADVIRLAQDHLKD
jgi:WD domain, G-beta repeat